MRSRYRELGLKLDSLENNRSHQYNKPPMEEEKRNKGEKDPINLFLMEALAQQRNEMLENFSQILQRLPIIAGASSSSSHFGDAAPFKVHTNFDIHVFEG
jgi:hypothetical protein